LLKLDSHDTSRMITLQDAYASIRAPFEHQLHRDLLRNVVCHLPEDIYGAVVG
jgi:hypothetical protein